MNTVPKGTCPKCNGTGAMPCPDHMRQYGQQSGWHGYNKENDTVNCNNCGAQYMYSKPSGQVTLRSDGTPCLHEYTGQDIGRCLTRYTCKHCKETHSIDSGD